MGLFYKVRTNQNVYIKDVLSGAIGKMPEAEYEKFGDTLVCSTIHEKQLTAEKKILGIMLVITMDCNFNCPYCFEKDNRNASYLRRSFIPDIISFIEKMFAHHNFDGLDVTFTGGEPMLNFEVIKEFVNHLHSTPNRKVFGHISYSIITNGYSLADDQMLFILRNEIALQISLDGNSSIHDRFRTTNDKKGSYEIILNNIKRMIRSSGRNNVSLRINLTQDNISGFSEMLKDLSSLKKINPFYVYPDLLSVHHSSPFFLPEDEKVELIDDALHLMSRYGMEIPSNYKYGANCMYKNNHSITIATDGSLYKCYSIVGVQNLSVGHINEFNSLSIYGSNSLCHVQCEYADLCNGGCPYNQYIEHQVMSRDCHYHFLDRINKSIFCLELQKLEGVHFPQKAVEKIYLER